MVDQQFAAVEDSIGKIRGILKTDQSRAMLADFENSWAEFREVEAELREVGLANSETRAKEMHEEISMPLYGTVYSANNDLLEDIRDRIAASTTANPGLVALESVVDGALDNLRSLFELERNMLITNDGVKLEALHGAIEAAALRYDAALAEAMSMVGASGRAAIAEIQAACDEWRAPLMETASLALRNTNFISNTMLNERLEPVFRSSFAAAEVMANRSNEVLDMAQADAQAAYHQTRTMLISAGVIAALIAAAAAVWLSVTISRGLARAVNVAKEVARGNLDVDARPKARTRSATSCTRWTAWSPTLRG